MKLKPFLFFLLFIPQLIIAQHAGNQNYVAMNSRQPVRAGQPSPYVGVEVNALMNVKASSYTAVFNVTQVGGTSDSTNNLINSRIEKIIKGVMALGIDRKDVHIDMVSFVPVYEVEVEKSFSAKLTTKSPKDSRSKKTSISTMWNRAFWTTSLPYVRTMRSTTW